ncbi:hypothetical protein D1007_06303 [Hordeum vulgare]|nr:hypothetical protein D1007_06303 [Hordeum vulgare]
MEEDHGDAGVAAGDVVELQGAVTADEVKDVGGVHGGAGKITNTVDVEKEVAVSASVLPEQKVTTSSGAVHPDTRDAQPGEEQEEDDGWGKKRKLAFTRFDLYDPEYSDDEEYEYDSREDVYRDNFKSFTTKDMKKIKAKGVASFFNHKIKKWRCPYYTTKPKPKDGRFDHLVSHAEDEEAPPQEPEVEASSWEEEAPQEPEVEAPPQEPEVEAPPQEPDVEALPQEPEVEAPPGYYLWPDQVVILNYIRSEAAVQARRLRQQQMQVARAMQEEAQVVAEEDQASAQADQAISDYEDA